MIAALTLAAVAAPQLIRLPNGIPVVVESTADRLVSIQALVRADDLTPEQAGGLEFLSGALFGETENYSLRELRNLAWIAGGSVEAAWAGDCLRLEITTTPDRLRPAAALLSEVLRKPLLTPSALSEARLLAKRRFERILATPPLSDVRAALTAQGLGAAPIDSLTEQQARGLMPLITPNRTAIGVVGAVSPDTVGEVFGASLGHWRASDTQGLPALKPVMRTPQRLARVVTAAGPGIDEPDFAAWIVACVAVGEGKTSALNRKFRQEMGAAYLVGTVFAFRSSKSACALYVGGRENSPLKVVTDSVPTDADVDRAKAYAAGRYEVGGVAEAGTVAAFAVGHETAAHRAFWHAWWQLHGAPISRDQTFAQELRSVTPEQARAAHVKWLTQAKEAPQEIR